MKKLVLTLAVAAALAACGGGGSSTSDTQTPSNNTPTNQTPVTGSQTGVLSDAEVAGVTYVTSSGVTGVTDAGGKYNYNPGDTVTFKLGALDLGTLPATGLVTPIDLAGSNANKLTNLLVVLQSLDSDGDPSNGISIPTAAASGMPAIDLTAPTNTIAQALQTAMTAGNITTPVKTADQAKDHYLAQAVTLLSKNIWVGMDGDKPVVALRVAADGKYLLGEAGTSDDAGQPGIETGTISALDVDAKGYKLKGTTIVDQNGEWGLSHNQEDERFVITDTQIKVRDTENDQPLPALVKMENDPTGLVGAWVLTDEAGTPSNGQMFLFFSTGYVMMVDAVGDIPEEGDTSCGGRGMEIGKYSYNASTKVITREPNPSMNTNGCAGLWESANDVNPTSINFALSADGKQATVTGQDAGGTWTATFKRISQ